MDPRSEHEVTKVWRCQPRIWRRGKLSSLLLAGTDIVGGLRHSSRDVDLVSLGNVECVNLRYSFVMNVTERFEF